MPYVLFWVGLVNVVGKFQQVEWDLFYSFRLICNDKKAVKTAPYKTPSPKLSKSTSWQNFQQWRHNNGDL